MSACVSIEFMHLITCILEYSIFRHPTADQNHSHDGYPIISSAILHVLHHADWILLISWIQTFHPFSWLWWSNHKCRLHYHQSRFKYIAGVSWGIQEGRHRPSYQDHWEGHGRALHTPTCWHTIWQEWCKDCMLHGLSLFLYLIEVFRKYRNGSIITTPHLSVSIQSLLASGLAGMPSITWTGIRSWALQRMYLAKRREIWRSWVLFRMQLPPYGRRFQLRIKRIILLLPRNGQRMLHQSIFNPGKSQSNSFHTIFYHFLHSSLEWHPQCVSGSSRTSKVNCIRHVVFALWFSQHMRVKIIILRLPCESNLC